MHINFTGEGRLWVYSGIQILYSPLFQFYFPIRGGGAWPPCALLSYANDSGVAPGFFNAGGGGGGKAREQSDRVGGRCGEYGDFRHFVYGKKRIFCTLHIEVRLYMYVYIVA